ncbi:MAG: MazG family protein [Actinobacteria bacterium]|nr:MazG family protein [Actinomycetota bacterium]MDA2975612.1 MazG family protein [Actinomycetota bacterium]
MTASHAQLTGVAKLVAVMDTLRSPGGCPWDAEQTHASLLEYLLEESHELIAAVELGDRDDLREELGDVLLQVVFHARIAQEHPSDAFDLDQIAEKTAAKLISRHPHVFADSTADTAADVEAIWHEQKKIEKSRASLLDGIPRSLPALMLATKMLKRTKQLDITSKQQLPNAVTEQITTQLQLGELLFELVQIARVQKIDPEAALRAAIREYEAKVLAAEATA